LRWGCSHSDVRAVRQCWSVIAETASAAQGIEANDKRVV